MTGAAFSAAANSLREQILLAAGECFHERGFKATTMHEIAKRSGMSVGNLYNYFDNKEAIVDEIAKREIDRLAREVDEVVNGRTTIEERREQFFRLHTRQLTLARARVKIELYEEAAKNERLGLILARSDEQIRALIKKMHRSRDMQVLTEEELDVHVEMIMALYDGLSFRLIANSKLDKERVARACADTIVH